MKLFTAVSLSAISARCLALRSQSPLVSPEAGVEQHPAVRVAIIGAGAAGSSAAYHLYQYAEAHDLAVNISIFEKSSYIGGRSTTVNVFEDPSYPIELGASIFVRVNEILYNISQAFDLPLDDALGENDPLSKFDFGVWDGEQFVYRQPTGGLGWWDMAKMLWRYGLAPLRTQKLVNSTISSFLRMYQEPIFPWASLTEAVEQTDLFDFTSSTGEQALKNHGISEKWGREIIQSSTRVNYGQNLASIHGLETMVCMATDDAMSIRGGNWQIFHRMARSSNANILLNNTVTNIERKIDDTGRTTYTISSSTASTLSRTEHDIVILAAPYQFANISVTSADSSASALKHTPDQIPYVNLHVTLLATPHHLSPSFFNINTTNLASDDDTVEAQSSVPSMVLTTLSPTDHKSAKDLGTAGVGRSGFWSVNHVRVIRSDHPSNPSERDLHVYKIFSPAPMNATFVSRLFSIPYSPPSSASSSSDPLTALPSSDLAWHVTKTWHSYPYLFPRVTFEPLRLDIDEGNNDVADAGAMGGFWYTSGMESFISTMETSALMGRNVAALVARGLARERRSSSSSSGQGIGLGGSVEEMNGSERVVA